MLVNFLSYYQQDFFLVNFIFSRQIYLLCSFGLLASLA